MRIFDRKVFLAILMSIHNVLYIVLYIFGNKEHLTCVTKLVTGSKQYDPLTAMQCMPLWHSYVLVESQQICKCSVLWNWKHPNRLHTCRSPAEIRVWTFCWTCRTSRWSSINATASTNLNYNGHWMAYKIKVDLAFCSPARMFSLNAHLRLRTSPFFTRQKSWSVIFPA